MQNYKFTLDNYCTVSGRKDLIITFSKEFPEDYLLDKPLAGLDKAELKNALKKPFYLSENIDIEIKFEGCEYFFTIPKGYDWNGANVPPSCWLIIGQQKEPRFKLASMVHDFLCENKEVINYNRYLSTLVFETLCEYFGRFNAFKRWLMFHSVDNAQKFRPGWKS